MEKADIKTRQLRCEGLKNPLGVDADAPMLSWQMESTQPGQCQTAWQVIVHRLTDAEAQACVWDSGKVRSPESAGIPYVGEPLMPRTRYLWKVRQWDSQGCPGPWSREALFETGLKNQFLGRWIGPSEKLAPRSRPDPLPAPMLRRSFVLEKKVHRGRVYICGLGYHLLYVNGKRIGDSILAPGVSQYDKTVYYETLDVTDALIVGENVIGVVLGNGWYNSHTKEPWGFDRAPWRARPKLWLQAHFLLEDGREQTILSDGNWTSSTGPWLADGLRNGECYDARMEKKGWAEPGYDDRDFLPVQLKRSPGGLRKSQQFTPIRRVHTMEAQEIRQTAPGVWVYDFGKNTSGAVRFCAKGYRDSRITFRYAERLDEQGNIDQTHIATYIKSGEFQTDHYVMRGDALECWSPEFTYHGFRYVEISGYPGEFTKENFRVDEIYTDLPVNAGFRCSDFLLNKIQTAAVQSALTNFHGLPEDCPHREKNGWTADAWLSAEQLLTNFDPTTVYRKWMTELRDAQWPDGSLPGIAPSTAWGYGRNGPAWGIAIIWIPWYQYLYCNDTVILSDNYSAMRKFYESLKLMDNDGLVCPDGEEAWALGDWMPPGGNGTRKCPVWVTDTLSYYAAAKLLAKIARVLGKNEDARTYDTDAAQIRAAFRRAFWPKDGTKKAVWGQSALSAALFHGVLEEHEKEACLAALQTEIKKVGNHVDTGFHGTKYLLHTLVEHDLVELGYRLICNTDYPGWGYMIHQGATTLWEDWEGKLSQNHHALSDISTFFYQGLAGIRPDPEHPGFWRFVLKPCAPRGMEWVEAWQNSPYGKIESRWYRKEGKLKYFFAVPTNTQAQLYLPDGTQRTLLPGQHHFILEEQI